MTVFTKEKYFFNKKNQSILDRLDEIEAMLAKIDSSNRPLAERILLGLDEIQHEILASNRDEVEALKIDTQFKFVSKRIEQSAPILVKALGGSKALKEKQSLYGVKKEQWWWYLDDFLRQKRKQKIKRYSLIGLILVILLGILAIVYDQFIAPPPEIRKRIIAESQINELIDQQDYSHAMDAVGNALVLYPDYAPFWIKKGALARVLNDQQTEEKSFEQAIQFSTDLETYYLYRCAAWMQLGLLDDLLNDADTIIELNPDSPEGYLYKGMAYENRGEMRAAFDAFEKAGELAEKKNDAQLAATIKVRLGMLMQSGSVPPVDN